MTLVNVDHKALAIGLNQRTWTLLEKSVRTAEESDEMIHVAHASLWHWLQAGGPVQQQRGEWLVGRVYVVLGVADAASRHARRTFDLTKTHAELLKDFDHAYAHELMARALLLAGQRQQARTNFDEAVRLGEKIAGEKDREIFNADLMAIPFEPTAGERV